MQKKSMANWPFKFRNGGKRSIMLSNWKENFRINKLIH